MDKDTIDRRRESGGGPTGRATADEIALLIIKRRWIGTDGKADPLGHSPYPGVLIEPFETD